MPQQKRIRESFMGRGKKRKTLTKFATIVFSYNRIVPCIFYKKNELNIQKKEDKPWNVITNSEKCIQ